MIEKICPFMSRPLVVGTNLIFDAQKNLMKVACLKENCMAWAEKDIRPGYCKLIEE